MIVGGPTAPAVNGPRGVGNPTMGFAVCAHRGASSTHPENTIAAFRAATALGVERIEFDVRRTRDGGLVIIHDVTVDRTTNGSGAVSDLTLAEVRALDAGSHLGEAFAGERVPTLAEALSSCPMMVNVHIYPGPHDLEAVVDDVIEEIRRQGRIETAFIAGADGVVDRTAQVEPRLARCWLGGQHEPDYPLKSLDRGCYILQPYYPNISAAMCEQAHALGLTVHPFWADDEERMQRLIDYGVDGILTNEPELLQRVARGLGVG